MFKKNLYRVCFGLAALATLGATTVLFAQDDDATKAKRPLSVRSIRPFQRSEKSTSQAPNLYDKKSDEFDYFREELGRSETSTKTKKRLQEIESRVTYADPMDKPAYDGSKFINIYDDVYVDGEPFEDPTDPDVAYSADENNILAIAAAALDISAQAISLQAGVSAGSANSMNSGKGSGSDMGSTVGPPHPMPNVGEMAAVGSMSSFDELSASGELNGPGAATSGSKSGGAAAVEPSKHDDTKMVFPEDLESPYKAEAKAIADEAFDFFKADREFKPKPQTSGSGMGYGPGPGMVGPGPGPGMVDPGPH